ncbi:MAG: Asp23/Gls24 family envelope stress response protein [Peptoniphilus sp.]|nr:Asp23/Gls24 family envelope stress response protein [Peptoniphilus sp.]MDD7362910.1 Asp23/Gls24 family envelope stress response protein [Bacillota bacterium]MDY6044150.1 Asp23/Gls24 family envelope stress response protein [Peptoniphilus sp.]
MVEKYFVDPSGNSNVKIANDVVTRIAQEAASRVDGVYNSHTTKREISDLLTGRSSSKTTVTGDEQRSVVDISIVVEYGKNIVEIAENVQDAVKESLENMTDIPIEAVNVHINGIRAEESETV